VRSEVLEALQGMQQLLHDWPFSMLQSKAIAATVHETYRRAAKSARKAAGSDDVERFHTWRKRVKDLLYQSQLLTGTELGVRKKHIKALDRLAEMLGEHHDLSVFEELLQDGQLFPDRDRTMQLLGQVVKARRKLEKRARKLGEPLMGMPVKKFFA